MRTSSVPPEAAHRLTIRQVFGALADERRWVCWRYETRNGKPTKVPIQPNGRRAKSDDPQTWTALSRCVTYAEATPGVGVGIVFNGDGLVGIDLDDCIDPSTGELAEWAEQVVADHASYTEKTPSGRGLHILCRGTLPGGATGTKRGKIEVYATGRYFTVTGSAWPGAPDEITDAQEALERLWTDLYAHGAPCAANGAGEASSAAYQAGDGPDTPWRRLNTSALAKLGAWVPELFGDAAKFVKGKGGYRIAAAALGRDLEEDLSIMPHGIRDWGMGDLGPDGADYGRQGKRTPIDLVLEFGGAPDELTAAAWLADKLGKRLEDFGFAASPGKREAKAEGGLEQAGQNARWNEALHRTERGEARDVLHNAVIILRTDERFAGRLRWNELLEAAEAERLPWRKGGGWQEWTDADDLQLANWCQERHAYLKPRTCAAAVQVVARDRMHHPVRERLDALAWDGTPRLDSWLFTYLGAAARADDSEKPETVEARQRYLQEVGRRWLISAVARIYQPGCKADHALILEGPQGAFKSTAAATLALEPAWFADEIADLGSKDSAQDLRGKWVIELGELSAMKRSEVERVKAFMSRRVDHYRPSYGVRSQDFPRQCTFIGTTNADAYLADETGGRRFWPVKVGRIDIEALQRAREQLWAEAVAAYRQGERWWLDADVEKAAREEQDDRRISDPWESVILSWIADKPRASVAEVLQHAIGMATERQDQRARNRVAAVLTGAGWKATRRRIDGSLARFYERPETQTRNSESAAAGAADPSADASDPEQSPVVPGVDTDTRNEKASNHAAVPGVPGVPGSSRIHTRARARPVVSENRGNTRNTRNSEPIGKCRTCPFTAPLNANGQCGACAHSKPQPPPRSSANMQVRP